MKLKGCLKMKSKLKKIDELVNIVEKILGFNHQNQEGKGLKMLTPNQTPSRLSITSGQLQGRNSSEELKNEIRELLRSFHR